MSIQSENSDLITYEEVLERISSDRNKNNHLLLGNGFNLSLKFDTSYQAIFNRMAERAPEYNDKEIVKIVKECGYNLEKLIQKVKERSKELSEERSNDEEDESIRKLLVSLTERDIRANFLSSTHEIITDNVDRVFKRYPIQIRTLMNSFNNYFTLNFDLLLYWLLFKLRKRYEKMAKSSEENVIELHPNVRKILVDLDPIHRSGAEVITEIADNRGGTRLNSINNKAIFSYVVSTAYKNADKDWSTKDIERAFDILKARRKSNQEKLNPFHLNDGFGSDRVYLGTINIQNELLASTRQNLFFLHGAMHIYIDSYGLTRRLTRNIATGKKLYEEVTDLLDEYCDKTTCVFTDTDKMAQIEKHEYLKLALKSFSKIRGNLVIIGCGFNENDDHIFRRIKKNKNISHIYISCLPEEEDNLRPKVEDYFKPEKFSLFNAEQIFPS